MVYLSTSRYAFETATIKNGFAEFSKRPDGFSVSGFLKALKLLPIPVIPFQNDLDKHEIYGSMGKAYLNMAKFLDDKDSTEYSDLLIQAEKYCQLSVELNPYDIDTAKRRAEVAFLLEKAGVPLADALPFFERLALLGPNHVENHYLIAAYFYYKGLEERLFKTITHITAIYPAEYGRIKKEEFYSPNLRPGIQKGIEKAIRDNVCLKQAYFAMGQFFRDEKNYSEAMAYYQKGLLAGPGENSTHLYLELGIMQLEAGLTESAFDTFETAMNTDLGSDDLIKRIYQIFKARKEFEAFLIFAARIDQPKLFPMSLGVYIAQARIELGFYELAKARLLQITSEKQNSEVYYLLALIGEKEENWDAMELNIQKATLLDPSNCKYYTIFAKSLAYQGKKTQAEFQHRRARECINSKKS